MSLHFLNDIIGQGTDEDSWRPSLFDYPTANAQAEMPTYPETDPRWGQLINNWALVELKGGYVPEMAADPRIDPLPDCPLETPVSQIDAGQMDALRAALTRRGIAIDVDGAGTFGGILAAISLRANAGAVTPAKAELSL